jgi:hypothetical protein
MGRMTIVSVQIPLPLQAIAPCALEAFREPGQKHLSPIRFRQSFVIPIIELERTLGAPLWLLRQEPDNPLVQLRLLAFLRVHAAVIELGMDPTSAIFHMRNTAIPSFGHKTLFEVVRHGRADHALGYLHSLGAGFVG